MERTISKLLIVVMVFSMLCFYQAGKGTSVKVYADGPEGETPQVETTPQEETTTPEVTTVPETTVPETTAVVKKTPAKVTGLKITDVICITKSKLEEIFLGYRVLGISFSRRKEQDVCL